MDCIMCGTEINPGDSVCPNCGAPVRTPPPPVAMPESTPEYKQPKKNSSKTGLVVLLCALILIGAFLVCMLLYTVLGQTTASTDESIAPTTQTALPTETSDQESHASNEVKPGAVADNGSLLVGGFSFSIPDDFSVSTLDANTKILTSSNGECNFLIFATDVSVMNEAAVKTYLPAQHKRFVSEGTVLLDEDIVDGTIAGDDVNFDCNIELDQDLNMYITLQSTFTDSWYAYTVLFKCDSTSDKISEHTAAFAICVGFAEYIGKTPRFEPIYYAANTTEAADSSVTDSYDVNPSGSKQQGTTSTPSEPTPQSPTQAPADTGPTAGERNALRSAKDYLSVMAFSYSGLIDQLEYEGYTTAEATYAADNCGANWNEQALKSALEYLDVMSFSYSGLIDQLEYEGFTSSQAKYGADNCGANWYEQAAKAAKEYLDVMSFSRAELIDQLEYEGFTYDQAVYGVEQNGL